MLEEMGSINPVLEWLHAMQLALAMVLGLSSTGSSGEASNTTDAIDRRTKYKRVIDLDSDDSSDESCLSDEDVGSTVGGVCMCGLGCRRLLLADEINFCSACSREHEGSWQCKCDACGQCRCCCTCDSTVSHRRHCPGHRTGIELCSECDDDDDDDSESSEVIDYSLAREDSA